MPHGNRQAQRLFGVPRDVGEVLLGALVEAKFLTHTRDGAFVRMDGAVPARSSAAARVTALGSVA
ncbi:MAG: hypothetical protein LC804_27750 [Acidobacteria bacterium]|nr:hypothetical protein [Acidobacteriota bacterium]